MHRLFWSLALTGLSLTATPAATPIYVSADVPTTPVAGTTLQPWEIYRYGLPGPAYTLVLSVPGQPQLDAIHKMDKPGDWIFSIDSPSHLGGALPGGAEARDVIRYVASAGSYALFFCGASLGIPGDTSIDAAYMEGGDAGNLVVSFDVPVHLGAFLFDPADTVRFRRTGAGCGGWTLLAANPVFDASASGTGIPLTTNGRDGDVDGGLTLLTWDVPTDAGPPGVVTYVPGQVVSWSGAAYAVYETLAGWPASSNVDGFSCEANPGVVPPTIAVNKALAPAGDLVVSWSASCSSGGVDYGIYQGTIGMWFSHASVVCTDAGADLTEQITPAGTSNYYIVVPHNALDEGSYGLQGPPVQRPVGAGACQTPQTITPCPP